MNKIFGLILLVLLFATNALGQIVSDKELKIIQDKVDEELKKENITDDQKLLLQITAAKEAFQFHFYDVANRYYQMAIENKSKENKTEAYINRLAISLKEKKQDKVKSQFEELKSYLANNSSYKTKEIEYYIKTLDAAFSHNESPENIPGFYGMYATEAQFKNLIADKKYDKALAFVNPNGLKKTSDSFNIISYDILNVLVNRKNVKGLYCSDELKKYPDAYAYSTLLCHLLSDYMKGGKMQKANLARAEKYFKSNSAEVRFLFEAVKEIK
jgi:hypothetical protein